MWREYHAFHEASALTEMSPEHFVSLTHEASLLVAGTSGLALQVQNWSFGDSFNTALP